jgi:HK97 family phage major capsid protein
MSTALSVTQRREIKTAIKEKLDAIDRLVGDEQRVQVKDANVHINPEDFAHARQLYAEVGEMKAVLDMASLGEKIHSHYDMDPESASIALATVGAGQGEAKTLGEWFTCSEKFRRLQETKNVRMDAPFEFDAPDVVRGGLFQERKDVYATMNPATYTRQLGSIQFDPMVPRAYRRTRVRDLFPVATTSSNAIDFFQAMGYASTNQGAKSVPDRSSDNSAFGQKPHTNIVFRSNQAPVRTIAHWEAAHRNVLDDVPQLQSMINNELLYGLQLEEDRQILFGSATNDELQGVMTAAGTQTYTAPTGELRTDSVRRAITKSVLVNYEATGIVVHPIDWEFMELQRGIIPGGSSGDGQYMVQNIAVGAQSTLWKLPVVETPAMQQGKFLTGAFGTGVQLYDRQQANVRTTDSHADFFTANAMVVLCEERLALAVKRPESLTVGNFISAGS